MINTYAFVTCSQLYAPTLKHSNEVYYVFNCKKNSIPRDKGARFCEETPQATVRSCSQNSPSSLSK